MERVEKAMQHLSWHCLVGCVLKTFEENQARGKTENLPTAHADVWCINDALRLQLWGRSCHFWCELTGKDRWDFPLSVDAVSKLYFYLRKRASSEVEAFDREIEERFRRDGVRFSTRQEQALFDKVGS